MKTSVDYRRESSGDDHNDRHPAVQAAEKGDRLRCRLRNPTVNRAVAALLTKLSALPFYRRIMVLRRTAAVCNFVTT